MKEPVLISFNELALPMLWHLARGWGLLALVSVAACALAAILVMRGASDAEEFDFIIVGGGATGSVVAGRLGQAGYSVLVLEAGGPTQAGPGDWTKRWKHRASGMIPLGPITSSAPTPSWG